MVEATLNFSLHPVQWYLFFVWFERDTAVIANSFILIHIHFFISVLSISMCMLDNSIFVVVYSIHGPPQFSLMSKLHAQVTLQLVFSTCLESSRSSARSHRQSLICGVEICWLLVDWVMTRPYSLRLFENDSRVLPAGCGNIYFENNLLKFFFFQQNRRKRRLWMRKRCWHFQRQSPLSLQ